MILAIATGATACKGDKSTSTLPANPAQEGELGKVVARVDDSVITLGDVQDGINKQAPFVRARYTSPEKRKEFLLTRGSLGRDRLRAVQSSRGAASIE
jgi:hypothetical protein